MTSLADLDLTLDLSKKEEAARLAAAQERLLKLRLTMGGLLGDGTLGPPLCVVFEGGDASGKGGAIKRLVDRLDPRHVRGSSTAAPTYDEKRHHCLWRFWPLLPGWGGMAVLDRSWYGRVLVERVEGFAAEVEWHRAYDEINEFEAQQNYDGTTIVKLFFHVTQEPQDARLKARLDHPWKRWKVTAEDFRNRARRDDYLLALQDMFDNTDTPWPPWTVIGGNNTKSRRIAALTAIADMLERAVPMKPPPAPADIGALAAEAFEK